MADTIGDLFESTGHPADLLSNQLPSVGMVLDAWDQLQECCDEFTAVHILDRLSIDPVISVERDERVTRADLSAVLAQLIRRRPGHPALRSSGQVRDALLRWVSTLPVSDREAAANGIRLVTWADACCFSLALDVVVPRGKTLIGWTPSAATTQAGGRHTQERATANACNEVSRVECVCDGDALIWSHEDPRLSSVIFADPDLVRAYVDSDLVCVYTPGFPVVGASPTGAVRLAEETMSDHRMLSFREAGELTWKGTRSGRR